MQAKLDALESGQDWLNWSHRLTATFLLAGIAGLVTYLHSDTGKKIDKLGSSIQDKNTAYTKAPACGRQARILYHGSGDTCKN